LRLVFPVGELIAIPLRDASRHADPQNSGAMRRENNFSFVIAGLDPAIQAEE
jgi:hypothetical protein